MNISAIADGMNIPAIADGHLRRHEYSSTTDHNREPAKSTLLPSKRVLNGSDVADWALVAPRAENGTIAKISN